MTFKDLQTLWDGEMLNDEVVNSSMALMQASWNVQLHNPWVH